MIPGFGRSEVVIIYPDIINIINNLRHVDIIHINETYLMTEPSTIANDIDIIHMSSNWYHHVAGWFWKTTNSFDGTLGPSKNPERRPEAGVQLVQLTGSS